MSSPRVVALGGGHGLHSSLSALRRVVPQPTAVVTVADNGGSSGRLRSEFGVLPPGDLRMALAALCGDDDWGRTWERVVQHRFSGDGDLSGHTVGNLLIVALWELFHEPVAALDWVGRLLGATGRVLPMAVTPMDITAQVEPAGGGEVTTLRGQVAVATAEGRILSVALDPADATACPEAVEAVREADWVVLGPGSWYTSVLPHLMVPGLRTALLETRARKLVVLNLTDQPGETGGFAPEDHLAVLWEEAPDLSVDVVLADAGAVADEDSLRKVVEGAGGRLVLDDVASDDGTPRHDPRRLASAYARVLGVPEPVEGD